MIENYLMPGVAAQDPLRQEQVGNFLRRLDEGRVTARGKAARRRPTAELRFSFLRGTCGAQGAQR
jgi:hypothetical protein